MVKVRKIFGAPGCGKTTRLMGILEEELKTVSPSRIAFVSFTRKGAYQGAEKAMSLLGLKEEQLPFFRTLHSIAFRHGDYSRYDMISPTDYRTFSEAMSMHFTGYYTEDLYGDDDKYLFMHFLSRNNPKYAESLRQDIDNRKLEEVERNYIRYKEYAGVHDFTDIIERFVKTGEPLPVDIALIDEAQDLTPLQWKMCEVAFANCLRVYVAGDDDQAIYEWNGADVGMFLDIEEESREVLGTSYRLKKNVLRASKEISSLITRRAEKDFRPNENREGDGEVLKYNSIDETPDESWYFLSRNNYFLPQIKDFVRKKARVFNDKEKLSYDPKHIAAIKAFESARRRGSMNEVEEIKLKQHVKIKVDLSKPWYDNLNFPNDTIAYYRDLIKSKTNMEDRSITVSTIHGVKGGEADNVVLLLDFTKSVRANMEKNPDSELRCLYVAMTRAKKRLHIVHSTSKNGYDSFVRI